MKKLQDQVEARERTGADIDRALDLKDTGDDIELGEEPELPESPRGEKRSLSPSGPPEKRPRP